ncbi:unnamed protein product [Aphanomyces euteiches]
MPIVQAASEATAAIAPDISYVTEGVDDGGTMVLMGDGFTADAEVWLQRPAKDDPALIKSHYGQQNGALPATPPASAVKMSIIGSPESHMLAVGQIGYPNLAVSNAVVPTIAWVHTQKGYSKPYMLNKPELYFVSDADAIPGQRVRLFGRNLERNFEMSGPDYDYPVALRNVSTGKITWGQVLVDEVQERANVKPYVLNVLLPPDIKAGDYTVSVHTLTGGDQAWSNTLPLKVVASRDLVGRMAHASDIKLATPSQSPNDDVRIDKVGGLNADGIHDDTDKIQQAIDKMNKKGGGLVILPAGNLAISKTIHVKENVVLTGAGKASTQLVVNETNPVTGSFPILTLFNSPAWVKGFVGDYGPYLKDRTPMVWLDNKTGLQDLSVLTGAGADIGVLIGTEDPQKRVKDVFIKRTEVTNRHTLLLKPQDYWAAYMGGVLVVSPTDGMVLTDNQLTADEPLFMMATRYPHAHANISNNVFDVAEHNNANNVFANGLSDSVFEDNEMKNGGRAFTSQMGLWRNWIAGNVITNIGGRANSSEMLMSEDGWVRPFKSGKTVTSTADLTTLDTNLGLANNEIVATGVEFYAYIKNGLGTGQYRKIIGNSATSAIKLDTPWTVIPDTSSEIDIIRGGIKNLFVNNWISNTRGNLQFSYGAGLDNTVAGNTLNNTGGITVFGGIEDWTDPDHPYVVPTAYNLIYANFMANTDSIRIVGNIGKNHAYGTAPLYDTGGMFANTIRRNQVWSRSMVGDINQYYNVWLNGPDKGPNQDGAIDVKDSVFTVVEGNYIYNTKNGIKIEAGKHSIVRSNRMDEVPNRILEIGNPQSVYKVPPAWEAPY